MKHWIYLSFIVLTVAAAWAITGDFNDDCRVTLCDFAYISIDWLNEDPNIVDSNTDMNSDGVVDLDDLDLFAAVWLTYGNDSNTPGPATNPYPADDATGVPTTVTFSWTLPTMECKPITVSGYLGKAGETLEAVCSEVACTSHEITVPEPGEYEWRVDTINSYGTTTGTVWSFTTVPEESPSGADANELAVAYIVHPIILTGSDDGYPLTPGRLKYIIQTLPSDPNAYLQDPTSGGQSRIDPNDLPYTLSSWGNIVWFATDTAGSDSFTYKIYDGNSLSDPNTISLTVSAHPHDHLSFDGQSYVSLPDANELDIVSGWAIDFWIQTRAPHVGILEKVDDGAGYWMKLVGGKPWFYVRDSEDNEYSFRYDWRVDDGAWHEIAVVYVDNDPNHDFTLEVDEGFYPFQSTALNGTFTNSEPLLIGTAANRGFKYNFDKLRFFSGITDAQAPSAMIQGLSGRTESGNEIASGFGIASDILYMCDEGTGTTIDDTKTTGPQGTINDPNHILWRPWYWHWYDSAFQQVR